MSTTSKSFRVATSGAPGPVHVELRGNTGQIAVGSSDHRHAFSLDIDRRFGEVPPFRPVADARDIREALNELRRAERPIIVAGGGVMWSRAEPELVELAERMSIPVATSLHAKASIPESNPLNVGICGTYSRSCANRAVAEADLVFYIGSQSGSMVTAFWHVPPPGTRVIHLDIDPTQLGRHYPTAVALNGDAKATLRQMLADAPRRENPVWLHRVASLVSEWREETASVLETNSGPVRPERIVAEIGAALPANGAVVVDTLQASVWSGSFMPLKGPLSAICALRWLARLGLSCRHWCAMCFT